MSRKKLVEKLLICINLTMIIIIFIRSVGNGVVKIIGKAEIEEQICLNAIKKVGEGIDDNQKKYIDDNNITYGNCKVYELGSWSNYFVTFKAKRIYKAKENIYLATTENKIIPQNIYILKETTRINNQSQKLYIEEGSDSYRTLLKVVETNYLWETNTISKVDTSKKDNIYKSFLSIIKKEYDELVNSNLLAHFLETDKEFWSDFATKVLKIDDECVINGTPKITRESISNIDLFIEVKQFVIVIENKIKSGINGKGENGYSQLEKYIDETKKHPFLENLERTFKFYLLRPNYNNEDYKEFDKNEEYKVIKYSEIHEIIKDRESESDFYFNEFKRVVKKHSAEYDNELFEIMDKRFIEQIKAKNNITINKCNT